MPKARPLTLSEVSALLPRLVATLQLLVGRGGKATRAAAAPSKGKMRGRRRQPSALAATLEALLGRSKKGLSLGELIAKAGGDRGAIKYHLRALRAQKKARVVGNRRHARWHAA